MAVSREIEENAMIRYFKTDNQRIQEEEKIGDGVWVQMLQRRIRNVPRLQKY